LPVEATAARHFQLNAPLLLKQFQRVRRQQPTRPLGALIGGVSALFGREVTGCLVGIVGDRLHELIVKFDRCITGERYPFLEQGVLQPHHPESDWTVAAVRSFGGLRRIKVDIDHVIKRPHRDAHRLPQLFEIKGTIFLEMAFKNDRTQVADGRLVFPGIERDLRAQI